MRKRGLGCVAGWLLLLAHTSGLAAGDLAELNACLAGRVMDFTHNHGCDRRIHSCALGLPRDLYVYLPPQYDPRRAYPLLLWLHGFGGDEEQFLRQVVSQLDASIVSGAMPPVIAAAPDGSLPRGLRPWCPGSWYINSHKGRWEDFVIEDVLGFLHQTYLIRPEREAHVIAGWSMGGFGSYNLGMKHADCFRLLVGLYPNLNLRYVDCDGHWGTDFDPDRTTWLEDLKWRWMMGSYPTYRFPVTAGSVYFPVWGRGGAAISRMSRENPVELLDRLGVEPGQFDMFVAYGRRDEFNVDAQVESFLHRAAEKKLPVWVRSNADGRHTGECVSEAMPDLLAAVGSRLRALLGPDQPMPPASVPQAAAMSAPPE